MDSKKILTQFKDTLTPEEIREGDYQFLALNDTDKMALFQQYHQLFIEKRFDPELLAPMQESYWQWYVRAAWELFDDLPKDTLAIVALYTATTAFRLGFHPETVFIGRLILLSEDDQNQLIQTMHQYMQERSLVFWRTKESYQDILHQYTLIIKQHKNSLERAEFLSHLRQVLFPVKNNNISVRENEQSERVTAWLHYYYYFYTQTTAKELVLSYYRLLDDVTRVDADPYYIVAQINREAKLQAFAKVIDPQIVSSLPEEVKEGLQELGLLKSLVLRQTKKQVEEKFGPIEHLSAAKISPVLAFLAQQGALQNEPTLASLIIFDEATHQFIWNDALLEASQETPPTSPEASPPPS